MIKCDTQKLNSDDVKKVINAGMDKCVEDVFDVLKDISTLTQNIKTVLNEKKVQTSIAKLGVIVSVNAFGEDMMTAFLGNGKGIEGAIIDVKNEWVKHQSAMSKGSEGGENVGEECKTDSEGE